MKAIDLFAGAGGSSLGLARAGCEVVWAGNHWPLAVRVHQANHPEALHVCQDLQQADWRRVPAHGLLWASPACQGHSQAATRNGTRPGRCARSSCTGKAPLAARGSAPAHDALRATAWAAVSAAEVHRPPLLVVENVKEFRDWALYPAWRQALAALGYATQELLIDSADLGVPQERERLFLVGRQGRRAPTLPERPEVALRERPLVGWDVVELERGRWRPLSEIQGELHQERVLAATKRWAREPAVLVQSVTGHTGRSLDRPLPTVTTQHQLGLAKRAGRGWLYRPLLLDEYARAMGFPEDYDWQGAGVSQGSVLLGNAVVPAVAEWVVSRLVA